MSASLVFGLTMAKRVTVSPSCVVGTTKARLAQQPVRPALVLLRRPPHPAEHHDGGVRLAQQLEVVALLDLGRGVPGDLERALDGRGVGVRAVGGQAEPEGQPAGAPGQPHRVVRGVELGGLGQHVQVAGLLGVRGPAQLRVAVDQRAAVERREQPLVRVDDEGVAALDAGVALADAGRREPGPAVRAVDVEPDPELGADLGHRGQVVHDAEVRGAGGGDHGEQALGSAGAPASPQVLAGQPAVVVHRHAEEVDVHDVAGALDRGVRLRRPGDLPAAGCSPPRAGRRAGRRPGRTGCRWCRRARTPRRPPPAGRPGR